MTTSATSNLAPAPAWKLWTGRVLSAIPALMMMLSATMKLVQPAQFLADWVGKFGYPEGAARPIGVVELTCVVLYLVPRTRVLGAILVTGYLGGAVATHVRLGEPAFVAPVLLGIIAWGGLFLRDERLQELLPLVKGK
jgi:hypothetical protein